jgi:hypothetical protein
LKAKTHPNRSERKNAFVEALRLHGVFTTKPIDESAREMVLEEIGNFVSFYSSKMLRSSLMG